MGPKLAAYQYVAFGFEMAIIEDEAKTWNLWWNITQSDDPEAWDMEIKFINKMQIELGELTLDQRLIRAHIAEFCRTHPLFPDSIDTMCRNIGQDRLSEHIKIGYEGRNLLDSLGYHDSQSLSDQRKNTFARYSHSLKKWLDEVRPENPMESKVFGFLGRHTGAKRSFVQKVLQVIDSNDTVVSSLMGLSEIECRRTHGKWVFDVFARPVRCFSCEKADPQRIPVLDNQCCDSMVLDAGILCSGTFDEKRSTFDEYRRFTEEYILVYSVPINSWLREEPPSLVGLPSDARYVTREEASEIAERIHVCLGEKNETKEWLAACLLKTMKDNQRWDGRDELVDGYPEAASWFRKKLSEPT